MVKKILVSLVVASTLFSANALACPKKDGLKSCKFKTEKNTSDKVIRAVSKTGLSAAQTKKIAEGIAEYEAEIVKIKAMKVFPVDSFINDEFNEQKFITEMSEKYMSAVAARATLYKFVFAVLDNEQRKIFKREYAAPLIMQILRSY